MMQLLGLMYLAMILRTMVDALSLWYLKTILEADTIDAVITLSHYFLRTFMIILFYKFLFRLKRVEFQISPDYNSIESVVTALKHYLKVEKCLVLSYLFWDLFYVGMFIYRVNDNI